MSDEQQGAAWPHTIYRLLREAKVRQISYVPDGGHKELIQHCTDDADMRTISLTTEQDGIGLASGAWLGGVRSAMLMQSSGVGNCINALSLIKNCQFPFLTFVTMRGDFGEANNWQMAMGQATPVVLGAMGMVCLRIEHAEEVEETVSAALRMSFLASQSIAVLLSQRLVGAKIFK
ncbi:thiamine pyrophosphate-binding protein [Sinorhizobium mexicanum]|uniref:Phosphonopyruvate decarboxylase n=1 Tax=Sinorhizobium mexicanum TaxID=375549 RepID=A0A859R004_9HYPH|nr:thiamine pyrophosphate-binding protein [Sinorhizobium mexicanum]MBP1888187.1 sulfopyruvate decarboxylase alpha subunit [Sinorhizobium mexicanum]QLL62968.1 phosphonopyruvate decarboxylase [Sinorhizobium mexicanum]